MPAVTEQRTLGRGIDYVESIARMLKDLSGHASLAFELIQNADDAPGASAMSFDIRKSALIVWNDGRFSDCGDQLTLGPERCRDLARTGHRCDFHRFRLVSSGDKRGIADTTGSFGIGFTAVYQVTDTPQLISSGYHWILDELRPEDQRITVCAGCDACEEEGGTRFVLPWARNSSSAFRQRTDSQPIDDDWIQSFVGTLEGTTATALLFLRKLNRIDIRIEGELDRSFTRQKSEDDVLIADGHTDRLWRLLSGTFQAEASAMRAAHPIEATRTSSLTIALPLDRHVEGLFCAYLPTEDRIGLPFHLNADFFPGSDRKHLLTHNYQGEWNRVAVERGAALLAEHLEDLPGLMGHTALWDLLLAAYKAASSAAPGQILGWSEAFWRTLAPRLATTPVMYTSVGEWLTSSSVRLLATPEEERSLPLFENLGLAIVHPEVRERCFQMPRREVLGLSEFGLGDLVESLESLGVTEPMEYEQLPSPLSRSDLRTMLWRELETLIGRSRQELFAVKPRLQALALAPTTRGQLSPFLSTYRADDRTVSLFTDIGSGVAFLDSKSFPTDSVRLVELCPSFSVHAAVEALEAMDPAELADVQVSGRVPSERIVAWFARQDEEQFGDHMQAEVSNLPIFPSARGPRPLTALALAGDFEDPLGLAELVLLDGIRPYVSFIESLGARGLDLETYISQFVRGAAAEANDFPDRWRAVLRLLASKLGEIADIPSIKPALEDLPLVEHGGGFAPASTVYFESDQVTRALGSDYRKAVLPRDNRDSLQAFNSWLGVASTPRPRDVSRRIRDLVDGPPDQTPRLAIVEIVAYLGDQTRGRSGTDLGPFTWLKGTRWLPAEGDETAWHLPNEVCSSFNRYLFSSQGTFLDVGLGIQRRASDFLTAIGVREYPTTAEVVEHLLYCAERREPVNRQVYTFLNQHANDPEIRLLRERRCLLLDSGEYVAPSEVFWGHHPFGRFRRTLGSAFQGYSELLTRLGVREGPEFDDAIAVLRTIANEFGQDNSPLDDEDDRRVVMKCWRMLDEALGANEIARDYLADLSKTKCVIDRRGLLVQPRYAFFEDLPGLVQKLGEALASSLISRPEGAWRAMSSAGVRNLNEAVATHIVERTDAVRDHELEQRVKARSRLLQRAIDPIAGVGDHELKKRLGSIRFLQVSNLQVQYSLETPSLTSSIYDELALYVPDEQTLYCRAGLQGRPWMLLAKELARALCPEVVPGAAAASLALALEPTSEEEASIRLDEAGLPTLTEEESGLATAGVAAGFGGLPPPDGESYGSTESGTGARDDEGSPPMKHGAGPGRLDAARSAEQQAAGEQAEDLSQLATTQPSGASAPRGRLRSYVVAEDPRQPKEPRETDSEERSAIDFAGIQRVMEFERTEGRHPTEMPHHNPGYDIESRSEQGELERYIEVKSLSGNWDSHGAGVTPAQFKRAQKEEGLFWLYIVERAERDDFSIFAIQNPAGKVDQFLFDDGWKAVADIPSSYGAE
jgi:uncharacterized protein DUF3883